MDDQQEHQNDGEAEPDEGESQEEVIRRREEPPHQTADERADPDVHE